MKKYIFIVIGVLIISLLSGFVWHQNQLKKIHHKNNVNHINYYNGKYKKNWNKIDSLLRINQPKTALKEVEYLMKLTEKKAEDAEWIRALMFKMQTTAQYEENYINKHILEMQGYTKTKPAPIKHILHSFMCSLYWNYYKNNSWKIQGRSVTAKFDNKDITTWDYEKFVLACHENYQLSLQDKKLLQETDIKDYQPILNSSNSFHLRPTLYDFLAHRALDFYTSTEIDLNNAKNQFKFDKPTYLQSAETYSTITLPQIKEFSYKYENARLLKELLAFRLQIGDKDALVDADLKRIKFVYSLATFAQKDKYYLEALTTIANNGHSSSARGNYCIAQYHFDKGDYVKAFEICEATIKKYPKSQGGQNCLSLKYKILIKNIHFDNEKLILPNQAILTKINHRNVDKIYVKIIPTTQRELDNVSFYKDGISTLKNFKKTKTISFILPTYTDYKSHSTEIKLPAQKAGKYVFVVSDSDDFNRKGNYVGYSYLTATNVSIINESQDDYQEFFVLNRTTGLPLVNKKVEVYYQEYSRTKRRYIYTKEKTVSTDSKGYIKLDRKQKGKSVYLKVFNTENDIYWNAHTYSTYKSSRYDYYGDRIQSHIFTDRKIYRPSQTVYFKGILVEYDRDNHKRRDIRPNTSATVILKDPNYQKVAEVKVRTNEYGTYSGTFTLPTGRLNGNYNIYDGYGNYSFKVEEYKRPTFESKINPIEGQFRINDKIEVTGNAKAFSGAVIDQAKVSYSIIRTVNFPYWYYGWWRPAPSIPSTTIINSTTVTDKEGKFKFEFQAIPDDAANLKDNPVFNYKISVNITDLNGETRSTNYSISVSNKALQLGLNIPDEMEKVTKKKFIISTTNLQGQHIPTKGNLLIERLEVPTKAFKKRLWKRPEKILDTKESFEKSFAFDYENYADKSLWKTTKTVLNTKFNTDKSKEIELKTFSKTGVYRITLESKDTYGEKVKLIKYTTIYDSDSKKMVVPQNFNVKSIKTTVEPNETAEILIGSSNKVRVLYEVEHNKNIIKREWINLNNEQLKLKLPVTEEHRGNFITRFITIYENRVYSKTQTITVPYTNKQLDIAFETFRDKLQPGEKEQWRLKLTGKNGDKVGAELVATLYDASLDQFASNNWYLSVFSNYYPKYSWNYDAFSQKSYTKSLTRNWNKSTSYRSNSYYNLDWNGYETYYHEYYDYLKEEESWAAADTEDASFDEEKKFYNTTGSVTRGSSNKRSGAAPRKPNFKRENKSMKKKRARKSAKMVANTKMDSIKLQVDGNQKSESTSTPIKARTNFNETAFFFPHLETDKDGAIIINFTIPESLTKWKMLGLAHTKDLKIGTIQNELVTQKDLMITANAPRFFRENDIIYFTAKINNLSGNVLNGTAKLELMDAISNQNIDNLLGNNENKQSFEIQAGQSTVITWKFKISDEVQAITYKVTAKAGNFTDGEQKTLPVLSNRMLVTETMPLWIRGKQKKTFSFKNFEKAKSETLKHHQYTLEFTANPTWYAVQALPYLMEYPYQCAEQTFSRLYANSISSHIANKHPVIKDVFKKWEKLTPDAFLSNLEKNQELKSALLQETPWVLQAKDENARKRKIAVLFDINRMANEEERAIKRLEQLQLASGAWPWFKGMREDRYVTQHIVTGAGKLRKLGVDNQKMTSMAKRAILYLDEQILKDYQWLKNKEKDLRKKHIGYTQIHYLYMRSFFPEVNLKNKFKEAYDYYNGQAKKYWARESRYMQGMIALTLSRSNQMEIPKLIVRGLEENSLYSEEMGMYWKDRYGYYWYQAPIETHALMIEVFDEVAKDAKVVENLRIWLLKNKQTNDWKTTKATVEACYVLLSKGGDWLANNELPTIEIGDYEIAYQGQNQKTDKKPKDVIVEAGTGYFKTTWNGKEIDKSMEEIKIDNPNSSIAWGGVYWQYFEQLDKVKHSETPLSLKKQLFVERKTPDKVTIVPVTEKTVLKRGDCIKVRIELRVDRAMEYIHMKDMRASGFEPENVISQYKYQDGLGYYESTKDASTNFFISYLPKGTFVFEYPLRVTHAGDFSNGITSIQSMYAPEFSSHSEGIKVNIKK